MRKILSVLGLTAALMLSAAPAYADPSPDHYSCSSCGWSLENCDQYGKCCGSCEHVPRRAN